MSQKQRKQDLFFSIIEPFKLSAGKLIVSLVLIELFPGFLPLFGTGSINLSSSFSSAARSTPSI